jgi:hypothetical protein
MHHEPRLAFVGCVAPRRGGAARGLLPVLVLLAAGASSLSAAERSGPRTLTWEAPTTGVEELRLEAGNGRVEVVATPGDAVRVSLRAELKRWSDDEPWRRMVSWFLTSAHKEDAALMSALALEHEQEGGALSLGLRPRGRTRTNRVAETWRVELPAGKRAVVRLDSGDVTVTGVAGGVEVRLGAGDVVVRAPQGDLDVTVGVGDIDVRLASLSTRDVVLEAQVGDTELWVAGNRVRHAREPGPGNHTSLRGSGRFDVRANVSVGDVAVRIGGA